MVVFPHDPVIPISCALLSYARQQQEPVALAKDYQPESGFVPFWEPLGDRKQSLHKLLAKRLPVDKHAHQLAHQSAQ